MRRRLSDWREAQRKRAQGSGDSATHQLLHECLSPHDVEADWQAEWKRQVFLWACEQIRKDVTAATWEAFWKTAVEGQPGKQVAADLSLTIAAVYHARSRVLSRLKELVQSRQES